MSKSTFAKSILKKPYYGYCEADGSIKKPGIKELTLQLLLSINVFENQRGRTAFSMFAFYLITGIFFVVYLMNYLSSSSIAFFTLTALVASHVYNTVWFHRYCSHSSFRFSNRKYTWLFLLSDPFFISEENYAIPHLTHHAIPDKAGDPYGPHLGWLGSFLGSYINTAIDTEISERHYQVVQNRVDHIGVRVNDYLTFKKTAVVEPFHLFFLRKVAAQVVWVTIAFLIGGVPFVFAYFAAVFLATTMILDFNWRGHGGNFRFNKTPNKEFNQRSRALNQPFYAWLASEWHDHHHHFPSSANCGFLDNQIDFSFLIIRFMKVMGLVNHYNDSNERFWTQAHKSVPRD